MAVKQRVAGVVACRFNGYIVDVVVEGNDVVIRIPFGGRSIALGVARRIVSEGAL